MTWRARYVSAEALILMGVALMFFVIPRLFPLAFIIILVPTVLQVLGWARSGWKGSGLPLISLQEARVSLAMEICGLSTAVLGEAINMDQRILLVQVALAILVGYVIGRWVWA